MKSILALGLLLIFSLSGLFPTNFFSTADGLELLHLPPADMPIQQWLKQFDWHEQKGSADKFLIKDQTLYMVSADSSTTIGTKFKEKLDPSSFSWIAFRYRVDELPVGTSVLNKKKDDAAFRLFVLFDKGGFLGITPPHTIGYVWDTTLPVGTNGKSETFSKVRYITIGSGTQGLGEWQICKRNLVDDYQKLFQTNKVPKIAAIGLKCDSNHSQSQSSSAIQWIRIGSE